MNIDRLLYRFGIVRRSVHDELQSAAEALLKEFHDCKHETASPVFGEYSCKSPNCDCPEMTCKMVHSIEPPVFKLIQGGKS